MPPPEPEHLAKAPVTEGLLDIRATLPEGFDAKAFESTHSRFKADYPNIEQRRKLALEAKITPRSAPAVTSSDVPWAYFFKSADGLTIAQFRVDGFTLNRLAPYTRWAELLPEALRLWSVYAEVAQPLAVPRVAVRYINRLEVLTDSRRREWLTWGPSAPTGLPGEISQYMVRLQSSIPQTNTTVVVTQALEPGLVAEKLSVLLDIDVHRTGDFGPEAGPLGAVLEELRTLKNAVFFSSLTPAALDAHR